MLRSTTTKGLTLLIIGFLMVNYSCRRGPNTQDPFPLDDHTAIDGSFEDVLWAEQGVIVREILSTSKNLFLKVETDSAQYWIATGPGSVKVGNRYFFNEAVVKYNFRSVELNREFDSVLLVTQFLPETRKGELKQIRYNPHQINTDSSSIDTETIEFNKDQVLQVTIDEILRSPQQFEGKSVELSGICTKVNMGIMERNWVHLRSVHTPGNKIVATTLLEPRVGDTVTIEAVVRTGKDFGAGYIYPVLLENARIPGSD